MSGALHDFERVAELAERLDFVWDQLQQALGDAEMYDEMQMLKDGRLTLRELIAIATVRCLYAGEHEHIDFRLKLGETVIQACDRYTEEYFGRYAGMEAER